jgi:hypothetical protein
VLEIRLQVGDRIAPHCCHGVRLARELEGMPVRLAGNYLNGLSMGDVAVHAAGPERALLLRADGRADTVAIDEAARSLAAPRIGPTRRIWWHTR